MQVQFVPSSFQFAVFTNCFPQPQKLGGNVGQDTITELLPCQWDLNGVGEGVVLMCWVDLWDINTVGQGRIRKFMQYQNSWKSQNIYTRSINEQFVHSNISMSKEILKTC